MMEFTFDAPAWEEALAAMPEGGSISAARLLTLLEGEPEDAMEEAFNLLEQKHITLLADDLPRISASGDTAVRLRLEEQLVESGTLPQGLEENDPLRLYLEEIASIPAAGDPELLALQYLDGDENAASRLTDLMLSKVFSLACAMTGRGVLLLDLMQEGSLGLWQAIRLFEGGSFESHCHWWICQYLAKAVTLQASAAGVGQKLRQAMEDYRDVDQRLLTELGRNPTLEEIALELHMEPEEAAVLEKMLQNIRAMALAKPAEQRPEEDPEDRQAVEDTAYFQVRQRIMELLSGLSETDARLLTLRYGLEGGLPMTPEQVGAKLGLTSQEVTSREAAALAKLRQQEE